MSASEKLKALNETGRGRDVYPHLLNALPQIVAVVEALETIRDVRFNEGRECISGRSAVEVAAVALDALSNALPRGEKVQPWDRPDWPERSGL